jgi:hypothetical protein
MTIKATAPRIAYFISPHGYGHAARAAAVMEALFRKAPSAEFHIFTTVPRWFFRDSLSGGFHLHPAITDIGLAQQTPLQADLPETIRRLDRFLPFDPTMVKRLARTLRRSRCRLVACDIAPLGILAARTAGIPSVLIENFTWDWIYQAYERDHPPIGRHIRALRSIFEVADFHIQTEPVCQRRQVDLLASPASRKPGLPCRETRRMLGIPKGLKVVLITMGGIETVFPFLEELRAQGNIRFIVPGGAKTIRRVDNLVLLPHHSKYFHPDLVAASDAVVGKVGYSTLAEVYAAGLPFGYVTRKGFRESMKLAAFIRRHMRGVSITETEFQTGAWLPRLPQLLLAPRIDRKEANGADEIARFILVLL